MSLLSQKVIVAAILIVGLPIQCDMWCLAEQQPETMKPQVEVTPAAACHGEASKGSSESGELRNESENCDHHGLREAETPPVLKVVFHQQEFAGTIAHASTLEVRTPFTAIRDFDVSVVLPPQSEHLLFLRI